MFDDWRGQRRLRSEIDELSGRYSAKRRAAEGDKRKLERLYVEHKFEIDGLLAELSQLKTKKLFRMLKQFGVEWQGDESWWYESPVTRKRWLNETGETRLRRLVVDARFNYWKRWVDLLSPIISTIISILALIVAIVALSK
jgi:hypothetical protein